MKSMKSRKSSPRAFPIPDYRSSSSQTPKPRARFSWDQMDAVREDLKILSITPEPPVGAFTVDEYSKRYNTGLRSGDRQCKRAVHFGRLETRVFMVKIKGLVRLRRYFWPVTGGNNAKQ